MKRLFLLLAIGFSISQTSCDLLGLGEDNVCGNKKSVFYTRTSFFTDDPSDTELLDRRYNQGSTSLRSEIILEKWVQHVCPNKHVKFGCSISLNGASDLNVASKGYWYFFFEEPLTLTPSSDGHARYWKGKGEIGLKQAYGESDEGEFTLQAKIDFPWQGSQAADSVYLSENLYSVDLFADYYAVK